MSPDFPQIEVEPRPGIKNSRRTSLSNGRRKKNRNVLVASLAISAGFLSVLVALIVIVGDWGSPLATNAEANRPSSSRVNEPEPTQPMILSHDADRLGPTQANHEQLDQFTRENSQAQIPRDRVPTDQELRGQPIATAQSFWKSCVDPALQRLALDPGVHLLEGIQQSAPNAGIDNFLVTGGVIIKPRTALENFVSILSCPGFKEVHSLREEVSFMHASCDVSPSGNYILQQTSVGAPGNQSRVLRLYSLQNGTAKDIPFEQQLLSVQFVSDDLILLHTKDRVLQLFDLQKETGKPIHEFSGTQLTYWKLTPGKRFVLVFSGASPASLRVIAVDDGRLRDHAQTTLEMEREFVIHHAEISPNGRYLHLGLLNPRASRKRLRIIDLATGETKQDVEDSELPESLSFSASHPVLTNDASWLFPQGKLVDSKTLTVTWRAEVVFTDFQSYDHDWFVCADNRAATFQPLSGRSAAKHLLVAELP
ncbi:hypothetical protein SH528x_002084 [Novipirellula sp. SH528]|uniref:hypothetical protein n=1 Tax=Novipirellula sp. SH528 TaxID=3454466 RepID=UPI003F9F666C